MSRAGKVLTLLAALLLGANAELLCLCAHAADAPDRAEDCCGAPGEPQKPDDPGSCCCSPDAGSPVALEAPPVCDSQIHTDPPAGAPGGVAPPFSRVLRRSFDDALQLRPAVPLFLRHAALLL